MACPTSRTLCNNLIISQAVTFADSTLTINIPDGSYANGKKYCLVVAQDIPTTTTITANVVVTIGDSTTEYPLVNCNCTNVTAAEISSNTRYSTIVRTNISSGVFKLTGPICNCNNTSAAAALPITTTTTTT